MFHVKHLKSNPAGQERQPLPGLRELFASAGLPWSQQQAQQFAIYHAALLQWNQRINLVSRKDQGRIVERHFLESALLAKFEVVQGTRAAVDIGTGAGFPGLPLKIVQPELVLTLLDSKRMKTLFLRDVIAKMELQDVEVVCERAEIVAGNPKLEQRFDLALSRAVGELAPVYDLARNFLKPEGTFIAIKGSQARQECERLKRAVPGIEVKIEQLAGNSDDRPRQVVFVSKRSWH